METQHRSDTLVMVAHIRKQEDVDAEASIDPQ